MEEAISSDQPGSRTDLFAKPADTVRTRDAAGFVFDTPRCRESSWGHRFELDVPPRANELDGYLARWLDQHGGKGVQRAYLSFETKDPLDGWTDTGPWKCDPLTVMCFDGDLSGTDVGEELGVRALLEDEDWVQLRMLAGADDSSQEAGSKELLRYFDWYYGGLRKRVERGEGMWWGIWDTHSPSASGYSLMAAAGLFWNGIEARFQDVQTHPRHRRNGHASTIVRHALRHWEGAHSGAVYIAATTDSPVERLYRHLEFKPCSYACAMSTAPSSS